jgi:glycosyltransferase involved in cell wall biosynthesis
MNKLIETPLISVLLSVYNDDENIKKSIDSILSQSYKNIELLVIDDGSTDKTYEILNGIKDSRLKIFRNKDNLGLTKCLNILIKKSQGQILARQDSDDISLPTRLEVQYNTLHKSELDACTTRAFIKNTKKSIPRFSHLLPVNLVIKYKNPFIHGTLMVRKNTVLNIGMYDENIKYAQDYKLFLELLKKNYKIKILKSKLYVLNMENNISSLKKEEQQYFFKKIQKEYL